MTTELIKKFNKMFSEGQLPEEFDYSIKPTEEIDWSKVKYNTFYKEPDFFINRFPEGFENIPGFDKIIDKMVDNALSPLEEMELRSESEDDASYAYLHKSAKAWGGRGMQFPTIKNEDDENNIDNIVEADNAEQESVFKFDE